MLRVELVSMAGALGFLLGERDVFFGNVGEPSNRRKFPRESTIICDPLALSVRL